MKRLINWIKKRRISLVKEPGWLTVAQSIDNHLIEIKKMRLEDEGIQCILFNQKDSSYNAFGYVYLQVRAEDFERAKEILADE